MYRNKETDNCGITWLNGITDDYGNDYTHASLSKEILEAIGNAGGSAAIVLFSDDDNGHTGRKLIKCIMRNKWGAVYRRLPSTVNPGSGNRIKMFVWKPSKKFFRDWDKYEEGQRSEWD